MTVERIVPERSFRAAPERTTYPRFAVDTVVEAPWGAYPTSSYPTYRYDGAFFDAYQRAHADPATAQAFWDERIVGPATHTEFLDANGGPETLLRIARRPT